MKGRSETGSLRTILDLSEVTNDAFKDDKTCWDNDAQLRKKMAEYPSMGFAITEKGQGHVDHLGLVSVKGRLAPTREVKLRKSKGWGQVNSPERQYS